MDPRYKIGMRTVKTVVAVGICLLTFQFCFPQSSINGIQAALAATICMKSSLQNTLRTGLDRAAGTVLGSVTGVLLLLFKGLLPFELTPLVGILGVLLIIYLCNVLRLQASVTISVVVFLIILIDDRDIPPVVYGAARLAETVFGIFVAYMVNRFLDVRHIKRKNAAAELPLEPSACIRGASDADIGAVMQIWLEANIAAHPFLDALYWHDRYDDVRRTVKAAQTVVYENGGKIQGFISLSAETEILALCVKPGAQHTGVGIRLIEHAKRLYPCLSVTCVKQNESAVKFLINRGFVPVAEKPAAQSGLSAYTMQWSSKNKASCRPVQAPRD